MVASMHLCSQSSNVPLPRLAGTVDESSHVKPVGGPAACPPTSRACSLKNASSRWRGDRPGRRASDPRSRRSTAPSPRREAELFEALRPRI